MYKWDLSYLYSSDELFEKDVELAATYIEKLSSFKGKLDNEENFKQFNLLQKEFEGIILKAYQYAHLASDLDKRDVANAQKVFKARAVHALWYWHHVHTLEQERRGRCKP